MKAEPAPARENYYNAHKTFSKRGRLKSNRHIEKKKRTTERTCVREAGISTADCPVHSADGDDLLKNIQKQDPFKGTDTSTHDPLG